MPSHWSRSIALSGALVFAAMVTACGSGDSGPSTGSSAGGAGTEAGVDGISGGGTSGTDGGGGTGQGGGAGGSSAVCTPGVSQCVNDTPETCDPSGQWRSGAPCASVCVNGACTGSCKPGATQCNGNTPQTCNAVGVWQSGTACTTGVCQNGACAGTCTPGDKQCSGNTPQTCDTSGSWQNGAACQYVCSGGACAGNCTPGSKQCSGNTPETCDASGSWRNGAPCAYVCSGGACAGSCTPGSKQCSGNTPETCDASGNWQSGTACPNLCSAGSCTGSCTPGAKQCNGNTVQTCDASGTWQNTSTCQYVCSAAACTGSCTPGATRCSGTTPQTCSASGQWVSGATCQYVCSAGSCSGVCTPGSKQCNATTPQTCNSSGQWVDGSACQYVCSAGSCSGVCTPGSKQCNGTTPQTCDQNGQWQNGAPCPYVCSAGSCTGSCTPGSTQCSATGVPQTCSSAGQWVDGTACGTHSVCQSGSCVCAPNYTNCSGACVDEQTDNNHCGSCTTVCTSPETCGGGGTPGQCGQSTCVPKTCSDFPAGTCGQQPDGCGGLTASCGTCSTSNIIASSRRADWSKAGVEGGIPNRTTICATLSPGATASQINSAIASCSNSGGGVVSLNAGTYNLAGGIDFAGHSNVTVRGAGADQTFLVFSAGVGCDGPTADVCFRPTSLSWPGGPQNTANWTSGYSQGTTQIGLSSVSNLKAGSMLILDQLDDSADTSNVLECEVAGSLCSMEGPAGGERSNRAEQQIVTVTAVSGSTVTVSPGLRMPNWRNSQQPGAWWGNATISGDGLEDLSLDHANSNDKSGIDLTEATNCWIKGVRSLHANRNHVWFYEATHDAIVDDYFYGTQNAASQSYGVESFMGSDNLVENNIFQHITGPLMNNGGTGSVEAYNYAYDDYYSVSSNWMMGALWLHAAASDMYLFEGNEGPGFTADDVHGTHNMVTIFRNRFLGWDPGRWGNSPGSSYYAQTTPIMLYTHSRYFNVIGNVLGWPGYHTNYQDAAPSGTNSNHSVFTLGWGGNTGTNGSVANDALTVSSLMRWGNYDTATGTVRWNASEVPSGLSQYANPVPSDHNLPASLFLSAPPSWWTTPWGTPAWPAIGPDVTGGPGPGGHSYDIPAKLCYANTAKDSSGVLKFSAASCYGK